MDACRFLGADLVVAFWAGRDGGSAGAAGEVLVVME